MLNESSTGRRALGGGSPATCRGLARSGREVLAERLGKPLQPAARAPSLLPVSHRGGVCSSRITSGAGGRRRRCRFTALGELGVGERPRGQLLVAEPVASVLLWST